MNFRVIVKFYKEYRTIKDQSTTIELKKAITHLKLISIKKNESISQLVFGQSDDKEKLEKLKKSFKNKGQRLNALLNEFISTNIPAMAH